LRQFERKRQRSANLGACHCHRSYIPDDEDGSGILVILNEGGTGLNTSNKKLIDVPHQPWRIKGLGCKLEVFGFVLANLGCLRDATLTGGKKTARRRFSSINVAGDNEDDYCAD
jgi:hypothetical protein